MSILHRSAATDEAAWDDLVVGLRGPAAPEPRRSPGLTCRWVTDPSDPERMICTWAAASS